MELSLLSFFLLFSSINGLFFAILAILRAKKDSLNLYAAIILTLCALIFFDEFTRVTPSFYNKYPSLLFYSAISWYFILPAIFMMIRYQVQRVKYEWYDFVHLLPIIVGVWTGNYFVEPEVRREFLSTLGSEIEPYDGKIIFSFQIILYTSWILNLLSKEYQYSIIQLIPKLRIWLKAILALLVVYFILMWVYIVSAELWDINLYMIDTWKTNFFALFIYGWLVLAFQESSVFNYSVKSVKTVSDKLRNKDFSEELKEIINEIKVRKIYLLQNLSVGILASELNISGRRITNLVNNELGLSVNQLINLFRIEEMEERFNTDNYKKYSLEGLALSAGFNSKSSFYRSFKLFKGINPTSHFASLKTER